MAQYEELIFDQGSDVAVELHLTNTNGSPKNLTYYTVEAQMRKTYNTSDSDATSFTTAVSAPATRGIVTLKLSNAQTSALAAGRYVYDVELSYIDSDSTTIVERILEGTIEVTPSVTR